MRRLAATLIVAVTLVLLYGTVDVNGQASCRFVLGFATLREQVGADKVGQCLEDEHFNLDNGNAEQRTSGGLMVWRKIDNFTAFTDGGTTWVNGPNGVQNRPNSERFSWERDPVTAPTVARAAQPAAPASGNNPAPSSAIAPPQVSQAAPAATSTLTPTATPTSTVGATATATKTATPTANPVEARFSDKPDTVETGSDVKFTVRTNAKKGTCTLLITYRRTAQAGMGAVEIDDGRCEWKWTLGTDVRTGDAKASVTVTGENGSVTIEDEFEVKKGDTIYGGDVNLEVEVDKMPDDAKVGEEIEVAVTSELRKRGTCDMAIAWPVIGPIGAESKTPDDRGRCSWKLTVPATITKKGTATVTITIKRNSTNYRTVTKEFDVRLP
jgi:hypothetical protein